MISSETEIKKWYEVLKNQALDRNDKSVATWTKYKYDLEETKSLLSFLPKKVKHDVMVPIGPKAIMHGKIVHTNEFLVNLGETWFATRTADQAMEICNRRIKKCDEMLQKLEKEVQLIVNKSTLPAKEEAFGSEERPEIIEYVTEEENEEWKIQHRLREKKYRQELAELRNKEKKKIETEEDLWKHLDDLEAQEELEDELNRLNAEYCSEDITTDNIEANSIIKEENNLEKVEEDNQKIREKTVGDNKIKKHAWFACDSDLNDEPLRLEIKHSECEPVPSDPNCEEIISPSDIYNHYKKFHNKIVSILKKSEHFNEQSNCNLSQNLEVEDTDTEEESESDKAISTSLFVKDVVERNVDVESALKVNSPNKKISKFKSSRMKNPCK